MSCYLNECETTQCQLAYMIQPFERDNCLEVSLIILIVSERILSRCGTRCVPEPIIFLGGDKAAAYHTNQQHKFATVIFFPLQTVNGTFLLLLRFLFHLLHLQKRVAKLKLPGLMDAGLFIESFAVGIDRAWSAANLFCTLTGTQPAGKCFTYLKLFGAQLGIALQKSLIVCQIDFFFFPDAPNGGS